MTSTTASRRVAAPTGAQALNAAATAGQSRAWASLGRLPAPSLRRDRCGGTPIDYLWGYPHNGRVANMNITPEMVHGLYNLARHLTHGAEGIGLVLTHRGWERATWSDDRWHAPIGVSGNDVLAHHDTDDYDPAVGEALAHPESEGGRSFRIPDEYGKLTEPEKGALVAVVTGDDRGDHRWESAWWFYEDEAVKYADRGLRKERTELLRTPSGRWVTSIRTQRGGDHTVWCEVSHDTAAQMVYDDENDLYDDSPNLPALVRAARAARRVVNAITDDGVDLTGPVDTAHTARAISELLRRRVVSHLRDTRAWAVRSLIDASDGDQSAAARKLGIHPSTVNKLIAADPQ